MPKRTPSRPLPEVVAQIVDAIDRTERFVAGLDFEAFKSDDKTHYAVIRCLEIISEATREIPQGAKDRYPEMPWKQIADSGNIYRHVYDKVSLRIVWDTVTVDLARLRDVMTKIAGSP